MSTVQLISQSEMWQLEPQTNLVVGMPEKDSRKLSSNAKPIRTSAYTWEDLRGVF